MTLDRAVLAFAAIMALISAALVYFVSVWWLLLTLFVGLNMLQSAFAGFYTAARVFRMLGMKPGISYK